MPIYSEVIGQQKIKDQKETLVLWFHHCVIYAVIIFLDPFRGLNSNKFSKVTTWYLKLDDETHLPVTSGALELLDIVLYIMKNQAHCLKQKLLPIRTFKYIPLLPSQNIGQFSFFS